jgi:branched-chain amino acid transport system permease protein
VLGIAFVLLVCFLRPGLIGAIEDVARRGTVKGATGDDAALLADTSSAAAQQGPRIVIVNAPAAMAIPKHRRYSDAFEGPILTASHLTKRYGGLLANSDINFAVNRGELRGIIGPNGAGKTTFFKMLTCEVPPTSGTIMFEGHDITGMTVTDVCQLGLTKSYQVNQLFSRLTVRENLTVAALATLRGKFRLDLLRQPPKIPGLTEQVEHTLELVDLTAHHDRPISALAYGEKRRLEVGLALASSPSLLLLDEPHRRHEPARTRGDGEVAQVDQPRPNRHHYRPRHGFTL